jgi:hypothetical protein
MKRSEIQPGYYYSQHGGWIRYVAAIEREMAYMIEFTGYAVMRIESLQHWALERHSPEEAKTRFPKEFAEVAEQMAKPPPPIVFWKYGHEVWPQSARP